MLFRILSILSLMMVLSACNQEASDGGNGASSSATAAAAPAHGGHVNGTEARALVADGAFLLDVRTVGEYERGHVEGSVNIPVNEVEARIAEVPEGREVVVYCLSGVRSASAAGMLRSRGYTVHDLGSYSAW